MSDSLSSKFSYIKELSSSENISLLKKEELIAIIQDLLESLSIAEKELAGYKEIFVALTTATSLSMNKDLSIN